MFKKHILFVAAVFSLIASCEKAVTMEDLRKEYNDKHSDTDNTDDTGNTGNSGDMDSNDAGDTAIDSDSGNTGDAGETCTGSDKFCHLHDGLAWSDKASDIMNWDNAATYCGNLGGRLPTISELRTLIKDCLSTETSGDCGVTDDCLSFNDCWKTPCCGCEKDESTFGKHSILGDTIYIWSSSVLPYNTNEVWFVDFLNGYLNTHGKEDSYGVRCVK